MSDQNPLRISTEFTLTSGRGAASGMREYAELGGSIAAQKPLFAARGLDLSAFYNGTLNLDIAPRRFSIIAPRLKLENICWHPDLPGETFSFCAAALEIGGAVYPALVYYPHPETKAAYGTMPPDTMIEVLAPFVENVRRGQQGGLWTDSNEIDIFLPS